MNWVKIVDDRVALEKRLLSYLKSKWDFNDYPLKVFEATRIKDKNFVWQAQIINWRMMGSAGATKEKAIANLKERFKSYRASNQTLPRPGTKVPLKIQYASTEQIDKYREVASDFFNNIHIDKFVRPLFISDISSLTAYEPPDTEKAKAQREAIIKQVTMIYGIDITNVYDGPMYKVFEMIKNNLINTNNQK